MRYFSFICAPGKYYRVAYEDDDKPLKFICQRCNGLLICSGRIGKLLCIKFIHAGMIIIVLYTEDIDLGNFYLQGTIRTKMQHIYQRLLKKVILITST